jgi:Kae1-associated kinase Bud32
LDVDAEGGWMLLSRIEGRPLYEALQDGSAGLDTVRAFGAIIRRLHESDIAHGDLTTHNVMIDEIGNLHLIDFGLARIAPEIEHLGLDLQVLNECLTASHHTYEGAVETMIEGYLAADSGEPTGLTQNPASAVVERFNAIRGRVRYHA